MKLVVDLHIHSRFSRATSKTMNLEELDLFAREKGVQVLGTGDFTHPKWMEELKNELEGAEEGLYVRKASHGQKNATRFLPTVEISCIYSKGGKVRKVHVLLFAPSLEAAEKLNGKLRKVGNIHSDGRPILGIDVADLAKLAFDVSPDFMVVPAHAWTPWFSVFGSKSGFDSLEECFGDVTPMIYAIETGLSSDPAMNWRLSRLDLVALISNSDCHSSRNIAREANVFDCQLSYKGIMEAIKAKDPKHFLYTIEFFPEEGKYHYDGHRDCKISISPTERLKKKMEACPVCGRPFTIGVLSRVEELADRPEGFVPKNAIPFKNLIPLSEIISDVLKVGKQSKAVQREYSKLLEGFGNELAILLDVSSGDLQEHTNFAIAEGIMRVREGRVSVAPGYDGVYGKIHILDDEERSPQLRLL